MVFFSILRLMDFILPIYLHVIAIDEYHTF